MSKPDYILSVSVSPEVHERLTRSISDKRAEECEISRLCCQLILDSKWASWLPFGWMHSLAARYYARKARRIYAKHKRTKIATSFISGTVPGTKELNCIIK